MKRLVVLLVVTLCLSVFAGCISDSEDGDENVGDDVQETVSWVLDEDLPWPSGQVARDYVESYVMEHPYRLNGGQFQTFMDTARDSLQALLESHNVTVERHDYGSGVNILGIIEGTSDPEQWVVLSAHYDTTESTVYGAWDDGTGVAALLALAEILPEWELPFTVVLAFFDEEEQGLVGSGAFVRDYNDEDTELDLVANVNMDPPGLNWPCGDASGSFPVKVIHDMEKVEGGALLRYPWLYDAMEHGLAETGVPEDARDYDPGIPIATVAGVGLTGTSDHANFNAQNIANVYLGGTPTTDADAAAVLTYPLHTPLDTLQATEARCTGGEGTLADGLQTTVSTVGHILAFMAEGGVPSDV